MKHFICKLLPTWFIFLTLLSGAWAAPEKHDKSPGVTLFFFWGEGCPHCEQAKPFLKELERKYPALHIESSEVMVHRENIPRLMEMAKALNKEATGVPTFIIGERMFSGFSAETADELEKYIRFSLETTAASQPEHKAIPADASYIIAPIIGRIDASNVSLPVFTIIIASLDSFNPCAFFVLLFLLSLLIHAHSRPRMILIGGVFVIFSGLIYFVFMAAWLNLFMLIGTLSAITVAAGIVALIVATINIKDYFFFKQGISLAIPEDKKPKLFARMRNLLRANSLASMLTGTVVLAVAANSYELLCTAGFPMVFTRMLTLQQFSTSQYYLYLALYNLIYIVPLAIIIGIFTITLGSRKLTEQQGRNLKLISGLMMFGLGLTLLINPALLNNPLTSVGLLVATLALSALIILWTGKTRLKRPGTNDTADP